MNSPQTRMRFKVMCMSLGLTAGVSLAALGQNFAQGCAGGACLTCGACLTKLPLLTLPILADGVVVLGKKVVPLWKKRFTGGESH